MTANSVSVGILGATGYTGIELLRLLQGHPWARVECMTSERYAGQAIDAVFPHLRGRDLPTLSKIGEHDLGALDAVFGCLPHGTTQDVIRELPRGPRVIDLSADFRLRDPEVYARTYGQPHRAIERQKDAVYGLTEHARDAIRATDLVANPGCYPTTAQLPLRPLLQARLIDPDEIVIDAKSGVTGAGRAAKESSLFSEVSEGLQAYGVSTHRHTPEIEQGLSDAAGRPVSVTFTPHLVPMNRGIFATIYVRLASGAEVPDLQAELERRYDGEPFARVLPPRSLPSTRHVRSTNACLMAVHPGRTPDRAILLSATDNLVKGASGQALQNMNLMLGLQETAGLEQPALFP
ncbi:MAG TPA: N-acetyl-gamma-glutamyl-phosphate reductase [Geminicoccaceae bacterium]|nr:N-acetyl-gamma-glutamyl-phosphate reductase [Geminicoccaceae bacterium]